MVVLLIPLLLLNYVDSQPTVVVEEAADPKVRSIAIVNEDTGAENNDQQINLGQEVAALLSNREGFKWTVVNRSTAESGLQNETYDGVLYIPSDFSQNVMTFKEEVPTKASLQYSIRPNMEAKNHERVQREFANVRNTVNKEMTTIYWNYVSQEVEHIRKQFDTILEKEIAFQEEMYSFYTPSSQELANQIEAQRNNLESILNQLQQTDETAEGNLEASLQAEERLSSFLDSLEDYIEMQQEQKALLEEAQVMNQEAIGAGIESFETTMNAATKSVLTKIDKLTIPEYEKDDDEEFIEQIKTMNGQLKDWQTWRTGEEHLNNQKAKLEDIQLQMIELYKENELYTILSTLEESIEADWEILDGEEETDPPPEGGGEDDGDGDQLATSSNNSEEEPTPIEFVKPEKPDEMDKEFLKNMEDNICSLQELLDILYPLEITEDIDSPCDQEISPNQEEGGNQSGESGTTGGYETETLTTINSTEQSNVQQTENDGTEPPPNWDKVGTILNNLFLEIKSAGDTVNNYEILWNEYANEWETQYGTVLSLVSEQFNSLEQKIIKNDTLPEGAKEKFDKLFKQEISNYDIPVLISYARNLSTYQSLLDLWNKPSDKILETLMEDNELQTSIDTLFALTEKESGFHNAILESIDTMNEDYADLIVNTLGFLETYETTVIGENESITKDLKSMLIQGEEITTALQEVNADVFEWEESPALQQLNGEMIFQMQQNTVSSLENLSDTLTSIEESQNNVTSYTEELQERVSTVQQRSNQLNSNWATNVDSTEKVRDDVYEVLSNTFVDDQSNPYVYDYLSNPVQVQGQANGQVLSEEEEAPPQTPPVVLFIIILVSGLLIGFLSSYYNTVPFMIQGALYILMNVAVGLIISLYGLNIYTLDDAQSLKWSIFTILLLFAASNVVRAGFTFGPFTGWLVSVGVIIFFVSPLINIIVTNFNFTNPVSNVYMSLLYNTDGNYYLVLLILLVVTLIASALVYSKQHFKRKKNMEEVEEDEAS